MKSTVTVIKVIRVPDKDEQQNSVPIGKPF